MATRTQMRNWNTVIAALMALILSACNSIEIQAPDSDEFVAGNYGFYRWRSPAILPKGKPANSRETVDPAVREAVDSSLQSKGYVKDEARAQFSVGYLYSIGLRDGVDSEQASNATTIPPRALNRDIDQASVDNAIALGGVKETSELHLQFNDTTTKKMVWETTLIEIVENVNETNSTQLNSKLLKAIPRALGPLPAAK